MMVNPFFRVGNYFFSTLGLIGAITVFLYAGEWSFSNFEQILYLSFFSSFAIIFFLFSRVFLHQKSVDVRNRALWFRLANSITIFMFLAFLGFAYHQVTSEDRIMLDPKTGYARIYRVDPEGYRKTRKIYYTFEFRGDRYRGMQSQLQPQHRIGDSVKVVFSESEPSENRILDDKNDN